MTLTTFLLDRLFTVVLACERVRAVRAVTLLSVCNRCGLVLAGGVRAVRAVIAQVLDFIAGGKAESAGCCPPLYYVRGCALPWRSGRTPPNSWRKNDMPKVSFNSVPAMGFKLRLDRQDYEFAGAVPHTRMDRTETTLLAWQTTCPECGVPFIAKTPMHTNGFTRRCPDCREIKNRKPVKGKRRRKVCLSVDDGAGCEMEKRA